MMGADLLFGSPTQPGRGMQKDLETGPVPGIGLEAGQRLDAYRPSQLVSPGIAFSTRFQASRVAFLALSQLSPVVPLAFS